MNQETNNNVNSELQAKITTILSSVVMDKPGTLKALSNSALPFMGLEYVTEYGNIRPIKNFSAVESAISSMKNDLFSSALDSLLPVQIKPGKAIHESEAMLKFSVPVIAKSIKVVVRPVLCCVNYNKVPGKIAVTNGHFLCWCDIPESANIGSVEVNKPFDTVKIREFFNNTNPDKYEYPSWQRVIPKRFDIERKINNLPLLLGFTKAYHNLVQGFKKSDICFCFGNACFDTMYICLMLEAFIKAGEDTVIFQRLEKEHTPVMFKGVKTSLQCMLMPLHLDKEDKENNMFFDVEKAVNRFDNDLLKDYTKIKVVASTFTCLKNSPLMALNKA